MPDITMCKDRQCERKATCYRFTAKPSGRQSYFARSPRDNDYCHHYWENLAQQITQALERQK